MRRPSTQWITALALCATVGLHWAVLQTVAWTTMFVGYAQSGTVVSALQKTFDGEHPCALCLAVKEGRASEKRQEAGTPTPKLDWVVENHAVTLLPAPPLDRPLVAAASRWRAWADTPLLPPPRTA